MVSERDSDAPVLAAGRRVLAFLECRAAYREVLGAGLTPHAMADVVARQRNGMFSTTYTQYGDDVTLFETDLRLLMVQLGFAVALPEQQEVSGDA